MKRTDVETHWDGRSHPAVKVKVYRTVNDLSADEWRDVIADLGLEGLDFGPAWLEAHLSEDSLYEWHNIACENNADDAFEYAREYLGASDAWLEGRSGGWLVVDGLPDLEDWDAVRLAKWARFVKVCEDLVRDVPRATAWLIGANVYERELAAFESVEAKRDEILADAMAALP